MAKLSENSPSGAKTAIKRIEHGLTYKHEIRKPSFRRRSLSPQKTQSLAVSPARVPLTCIKEPLNTKLVPIALGKHDLTKALSTAEKENDDNNTNDTQKIEMLDVESDAVEVQSSPVGSHQNRMNSKRHMDTPVLVSDAKKMHLGDESFQTPLRPDSKKRVTPHREHHSRLMNDSDIDLHNASTENPVLDPQNSPLANVSHGQLLEDKIDGETEVIKGLKHRGTQINDISAIAADSSLDHREDTSDSEGEQDERMSPVKLSQKISALDVFSAMIDQEDEIEDFDLAGGDEAEEKPVFTNSQLEEVKSSMQSSIDALKVQVQVQSEKLVSAETALASVSAQLEAESGEKKHLLNEKTELIVELQSYKQSIQLSNSKISQLESRVKFYESKLEKLKTIYSQLMGTAKNFESELTDKTVRITDLEISVTSLKEEKTVLSNEKIELLSALELRSNEIEQLTKEKESLENQLKNVSSSSESALRKTEDLVRELDSKTKDAAELREKLDEQAVKIEGLELDLSQATEKLNAYQDELRSGVDKIIALENELSAVRSELESLQEKETLLVDENTSLKEVMGHRRDEIKRLKAEKEELSQQLSSRKDQNTEELLEKLREEMSALRGSTEAQINELSANLDAKNEKLVEAKTEASTMKQKVATLESQLADANAKIQEHDKNLEQQLEKLAQDLYLQYSAKHEQKVAILKKGYEMKWMNKLKKLNKENEQLRSEVESFKRRLEVENNEKKQLVKLWEEYVSLESNDKANALPDFIKKAED
ncbi:hypothetical protein KL905_004180 [Ogataea polymorpha]|uniref:Uncharacterized protein n=1 Tax=Ogataea polymorpha TaxID=460523 RepID=A0A9P8NUA2_9ASCO|nr:hypothetical protein KL908_004259 [Ogataea polymorpha]KAG7907296.1 hypothetical protein KL906_003983 [Ogataea polymorpha]KAG7915213.1 hypothetical protein KL927_004202 [Ogataea polymorpha]KAG7918101.1 hypothetical protein KL905_004180 [Ogataea polymorpha]KAG7932419.1 hypothetical protein KL934_003862 [Ogataea polymorpha]